MAKEWLLWGALLQKRVDKLRTDRMDEKSLNSDKLANSDDNYFKVQLFSLLSAYRNTLIDFIIVVIGKEEIS